MIVPRVEPTRIGIAILFQSSLVGRTFLISCVGYCSPVKALGMSEKIWEKANRPMRAGRSSNPVVR